MHVDVLVRNRDGSDFYRLIEPARVLRDEGYDVKIIPTALSARRDSTVVMSRPLGETGLSTVDWLTSHGHRTVVDMDDDFDNLPATHGIYGMVDTSYIHAACKLADLVTTSTPALADLYGHEHSEVLPNCVPARYLTVGRGYDHETKWVGWYGGRHAHPEDPQVTNGGVSRAVESAAAAFSFVGDKRDAGWLRSSLKLRGELLLGGWYTLNDLPMAVVNFDVGVVPLANILFNESKSWLKSAEMASLGVPVVMSPTTENRRLNALGVGVLATYPNEWYREVSQLLTNEDHRQYKSQIGRAAMETLTYENQVERWLNIWQPDTL